VLDLRFWGIGDGDGDGDGLDGLIEGWLNLLGYF
jgi:hypothetical protein